MTDLNVIAHVFRD